MKYKKIVEGRFISRPNRFIAHVEIDGKTEICHVKNTGRCKELLVPGARLILEDCQKPERKTRYDVVGVQKGNTLINMDSQMPNKVVAQWIREGNLWKGLTLLKPETTYGNSRFDIYGEYGTKKAYMEIKGVTLEVDGIARFPDAPTQRGIKHMEELCKCKEDGYEAYLMFVIQMKGIRQFEPNWNTHEAFGLALQRASACGVKILAYDCQVTDDTINIDAPVPIHLERVES